MFSAGASQRRCTRSQILQTRLFPRWIGWLALAVGLLAGWIGMLSPLADAFEVISSLGFLAFFIFIPAMGVAMLRRGRAIDEPTAEPT
jgi:hypothetical protein